MRRIVHSKRDLHLLMKAFMLFVAQNAGPFFNLTAASFPGPWSRRCFTSWTGARLNRYVISLHQVHFFPLWWRRFGFLPLFFPPGKGFIVEFFPSSSPPSSVLSSCSCLSSRSRSPSSLSSVNESCLARDEVVHYNVSSRTPQSNSVYVSVLKIAIAHADSLSKSLRQKSFFRASGHS